jgi:GT2 family glycosyltransferase
MKLSIIIVSYNTAELTKQTINSVVATVSEKLDYEIIVVDNDSRDDTVAQLKKLRLPRLTIIETGENLGFGKGNNAGVKVARGDYLLFLNSDTIVGAGALENLVATYEKLENEGDKIGLLAASLWNKDGSYQAQGGDLPSVLAVASQWWFWDDVPFLRRFLPSMQHTGKNAINQKSISTAQTKCVRPSGWVGGTAVLINRQLFEKYGGWDENIFMYGEDIEWCCRLAQENYHSAIDFSSEIVHLGQASSSSKNALLGEIKGLLYVWQKYHGRKHLWLIRQIVAWGCILRILYYSIKRKREVAKIYAQGFDLARQ